MNQEEKAQCAKCGVTILRTTASGHDGYCVPCFNQINGVVKPAYTPPPRRPIADFFGALMPIGFLLIFILGIPLGYKLVLGDRTKPLAKGTIREVALDYEQSGASLNGHEVKVLPAYLIVDPGSSTESWIPTERVRVLKINTK